MPGLYWLQNVNLIKMARHYTSAPWSPCPHSQCTAGHRHSRLKLAASDVPLSLSSPALKTKAPFLRLAVRTSSTFHAQSPQSYAPRVGTPDPAAPRTCQGMLLPSPFSACLLEVSLSSAASITSHNDHNNHNHQCPLKAACGWGRGPAL